MNRNKPFLNSSLQKAAESAGIAGEFRCHSLHLVLSRELSSRVQGEPVFRIRGVLRFNIRGNYNDEFGYGFAARYSPFRMSTPPPLTLLSLVSPERSVVSSVLPSSFCKRPLSVDTTAVSLR
jgi:hypothetical protein